MRPGDTVARLGGDKFAVLHTGLDRVEDAGRLASRLLSTLAVPFAFAGQVMPVSASLGIAIAPMDGSDYPTLLRRADAALYRAKADGRGRFAFLRASVWEVNRRRSSASHSRVAKKLSPMALSQARSPSP